MNHYQPDQQNRDYEPPPTQRDVRSLRWPLYLATFLVAGMLLAVLAAWSPWDDGNERGGQGGSDIPVERTAVPPPIQQGTPNP